jgi:hypothetical protein
VAEAQGRSIDTGTVRFSLREDGLVHGQALPHRVQSIEDARRNTEALERLTQGVKRPLLLDIRTTGTLSREARQHYAESGGRFITRLAFVADSAFTRVVGNIFTRVARPHYPVRLFASEEAAMRWLKDVEP